ncbi:SDR family oxidoreductase [Terriglobus sp.]|uniref:SDR family oxidoreductase n=1 Tax=Terriglobus sp. TaxID=1889013 RepID=UPI003AFFBC29
MKLTGNTILITGGTSGIGLELALQLLHMGNHVIVTGREQDKIDALAKEHPALVTMKSDVSEPSAISQLYERITTDYPALNILVNNAGIMRKINLQDRGVDLDDITREVDVNLSGSIRMTKQFLPHLRTQPSAAIINVSSGLAFVPFPISPVYSATKAGVHAFTKALRVQMKNTKIRVFELAPPSTQTPLQNAFSAKDVKASANMDVKTLVQKTLHGLERNHLEIRPGSSNILHLLSRVAPKLALRLTSGSINDMLAQTQI